MIDGRPCFGSAYSCAETVAHDTRSGSTAHVTQHAGYERTLASLLRVVILRHWSPCSSFPRRVSAMHMPDLFNVVLVHRGLLTLHTAYDMVQRAGLLWYSSGLDTIDRPILSTADQHGYYRRKINPWPSAQTIITHSSSPSRRLVTSHPCDSTAQLWLCCLLPSTISQNKDWSLRRAQVRPSSSATNSIPSRVADVGREKGR